MPETMKAVTFYGPGDIRIEEVPRPEIEEGNDALIKISRSSICGTDLHPYHGRMDIEDGFVLGHEYMGTVEAVADGVTAIEAGDRVVGSFMSCCGKCWWCRRGEYPKCIAARVFGLGMAFGDLPGAQSEYLRVPEADLTLRKVPDNDSLDDDDVLFVGDILTTAYDAIYKSGLHPGDVVAVVGGGPVGLCAMMSALAMGAGKVVAIDMVDERLKLAESIGAIGVNPNETPPEDVILELTDWRGADVVVDAVGHESALRATVPLVRGGGTITVAGVYLEDEMTVPFGDLWLKNVTLVMGIANIQGRMDEAMELVRAGKVDPKVIISDRMGLSEAVDGYARFDAKEASKIVLDPGS
jgi:2-desacetyl-2-hydroxyethyl bacteriochlorophyllide A dehydrogenase